MFARILLTIAAIQYGFVPLIVDLSPSHVFHTEWPGHARFHMVWLLAVSCGMATYVLWLVWWLAANRLARLKRALPIGFVLLGGFFLSSSLMPLYSGLLADPEHQVTILGSDGNMFAFSIAFLIQVIATIIIWRSPQT